MRCWRRLLRVPWTARRSNQSILRRSVLECPLEGLMLKLKLQYFGHLMRRADSFEKTLMLEKIEGRRRRGRQRMRWLDGITDSMEMEFGRCLWSSTESDTTEQLKRTERLISLLGITMLMAGHVSEPLAHYPEDKKRRVIRTVSEPC